MRSTFRATSHIARLLNTIPGNEFAEDVGADLDPEGTTTADDWCEWARCATSLKAFSSFACWAVNGRTQRPYSAAPSRAADGKASKRQIAWSPSSAGSGRPFLVKISTTATSPAAISCSSSPSAQRNVGLPASDVAQIDKP